MPPTKSTSRRSDQPAESSHSTRSTSPAPIGTTSHRSKGKRGPSRTSCAECRRLKLKCDGKFPCYQCVKRGYTAICPEGTLTTGQGHRLFWNTTTDNRVKLSGYKDRIAQLEEALRSAHSVVSNEPHPLLSEEHLRIKDNGTPLTINNLEQRQSSPSDGRGSPDNEVFDRFGSLSLTANGGSRFFGHAANSWILMDNEENDLDEDYAAPSIGLCQILPPELLMQTGISLPDMMGRPYTMTREDELQLLVDLLPPEEEAIKLNGNSYKYGFFSWQPIPFDEYRSNIFEPLYKQQPQFDHPLFAARLAVMYTMLAHGAQTSPDCRHNGPEAERYHHLSRAAIVHARLMNSPTIEGIQALFLMSLYLSFSDTASRDTSNVRWCITGFMMKLCQITGLQSDPSRYNLSPAEIKRRTLLFSEIYMYDLTQALMYSRPPAIAVGYFDVKPYLDETMGPETHYHIWKYKFGVECLGPVHAQAYSATPPTYSTVLTLARRVEDYPAFTPPDNEEERKRPDHPARMTQARTSRSHKEDVLLHMHRPFCILATEKYKDDPLNSEYGSSVIAAYRSAHRLISYGNLSYEKSPHPINRAWLLWARVYDAAIVLGTLAIRCPHLSFATDAYNQLRVACNLFHHAREALEAENVYEKLMKTLDLAYESISAFTAGTTDAGKTSEAEALLVKLGTKPLQTKRPDTCANSQKSNLSSHSSWSPFEDPAVPLNLPSSATSTKYHPNVLEYVNSHSDTGPQGLILSPIQMEWGMTADHGLDGFIPSGMVAPDDLETPSSASFGGSPSAHAYHSAISRNPTELRADIIAYPSSGSISGFRRRDPTTGQALPQFDTPLDPMDPSGAAFTQFADVPLTLAAQSSFGIGPGIGYQTRSHQQYAGGPVHPSHHYQTNQPLPVHSLRYGQTSQVNNQTGPVWTGQFTPHMYPSR